MRGPALALLLLAAPARANTRAGTEVRPSGPSSVPGAAADPLRASPLDLPLLPSDVLSTPLPPQTAAPLALPPAEVPAAMGAAPAQERRDEAPLAPARAQLEAAMDGADEAGSADSTEGSAAGAGASFDGLLRAASEGDASFPYLSRLDASGAIDGNPAERLSTIGAANAGVYRLSRDGSPRILKVLLLGPKSTKGAAQAVAGQLRGARLGQLFGGPAVRRAGVLEKPDGEGLFFIEMDELFPGRLSYSLKELYALAEDRGDKEEYALVAGRPAARMGVMLARVLESGVIPRDLDFLVSEDGEVAWLDANQWYRADLATSEGAQHAGHQIRAAAHRLAAGSGPAARTFLESFLRALKAAPRIEERTRRALLREAFFGTKGTVGEDFVNKVAERVAREAGLPGRGYPAIVAFYESLPGPN